MSKVKTDNLEAYTTSGSISILSPLAVTGINPLIVGGQISASQGVNVSNGLIVTTGDCSTLAGDIKVGPAGAETATISNAGAASFASLLVNGQAVTGNAAGGRIHAFGTATKGAPGSGNGTVTGYNVTACTHTASTITVTYPTLSETTKFAIGLPASATQVITGVTATSASVQFDVNADEVTTIFFAVLGG